jgi:hypothetical protein
MASGWRLTLAANYKAFAVARSWTNLEDNSFA